MRPVFEFSELSYAYPKSDALALDSVNFALYPGESFALLGPNGSGKTTLMRILCGRISQASGCVNISDDFQKDGKLDLSKCGVLLENPGIYPKLSIEEYLKFFAAFYVVRDAEAAIRNLGKKLELPSLSTPMGSLSQGTRQKVQIARTLLHRPSLLLLDEPVANLDPCAREAVWAILDEWKKECGGTLLVSSHILSEMESVATTFAILYKGKILCEQKMSDLLSDEFLLRVKIPEGYSPRELYSKIPPGTKVLQVEAGKKSLNALYREAVERFEQNRFSLRRKNE